MPPTPASVVEQWHNLPRTVLQDKVRQVVKRRDADARQIWAHVRSNSVLAAQVRGTLSALRAEVKGTRDEVMWTMWIDQARAILDASPDKPSAEKSVAEKSVAADKAATENGTVAKTAAAKTPAGKTPAGHTAAAVKTPVAKTSVAKTAGANTAGGNTAVAKKPEPAPAAEAEPQTELAFAPKPADKPRTAPPVPPVLFQAPGT